MKEDVGRRIINTSDCNCGWHERTITKEDAGRVAQAVRIRRRAPGSCIVARPAVEVHSDPPRPG